MRLGCRGLGALFSAIACDRVVMQGDIGAPASDAAGVTFVLDGKIVTLRNAPVDEIIRLRRDVLRPGLELSAAAYDEDRHSTTLHFGAFLQNREAIGCATVLLKGKPGDPQWQLRGMATHPDYIRRGVGSRLLAFAEESLAKATPGRLLFANAREVAVPFYEKQGWELSSDKFDVPGIGPHFQITKRPEAELPDRV